MKRKLEYPSFEVQTQVRVNKDILRYPTGTNGVNEPYILVPSGTVGVIEGGLRWGNYIVRFPYIATLNVYALRLEAVEEVQP